MTGTDGRFALKNGQTAKFIGTMDEDDGKSYYITEADNGASWIAPKWSYQAEAAGGFHVVDSDSAGTSMSVTAKVKQTKQIRYRSPVKMKCCTKKQHLLRQMTIILFWTTDFRLKLILW